MEENASRTMDEQGKLLLRQAWQKIVDITMWFAKETEKAELDADPGVAMVLAQAGFSAGLGLLGSIHRPSSPPFYLAHLRSDCFCHRCTARDSVCHGYQG